MDEKKLTPAKLAEQMSGDVESVENVTDRNGRSRYYLVLKNTANIDKLQAGLDSLEISSEPHESGLFPDKKIISVKGSMLRSHEVEFLNAINAEVTKKNNAKEDTDKAEKIKNANGALKVKHSLQEQVVSNKWLANNTKIYDGIIDRNGNKMVYFRATESNDLDAIAEQLEIVGLESEQYISGLFPDEVILRVSKNSETIHKIAGILKLYEQVKLIRELIEHTKNERKLNK